MALSCKNSTPAGFVSNIIKGALWPLILVHSDRVDSENFVPENSNKEQFESSNVGMLYTCMSIAITTQKYEDAKLFTKVIKYLNSNFESTRKQHDDFMKLGAEAAVNAESAGITNEFYEAACVKRAENIKLLMK